MFVDYNFVAYICTNNIMAYICIDNDYIINYLIF